MSLASNIEALTTRVATEFNSVRTAIAGKANTSHTHTKSQITDFTHTHNTADLVTTVNDKSANYTIVAADKNEVIRSTGSAITITLANVLAVGERIDFIQDGTGQITFTASGVTLSSYQSKLKTAGQYAGATVICVASGQYRLIGNLA